MNKIPWGYIDSIREKGSGSERTPGKKDKAF